MSVDLTKYESPITPAGELKLTDQEIAYLQSFLDRGDRGGYYMALYNMTGNTQCIEQAQIATFSEGSGGVAYVANYLLQEHLVQGYPGIYFLSQEVAKASLQAIRDKREDNRTNGNQNSGYINTQEMFASANEAWRINWTEDDFPGNFLDSTLGQVIDHFDLPPLPDELSTFEAIAATAADLYGIDALNVEAFRSRLLTDGTLSAVLGLGGGWLVGKQLAAYEDDPERYRIDELPDGSHKVVTDLQMNKVVGVFGSSIIPTTPAEVLNRFAANLPAILAAIAGGVPVGFGVALLLDFFQGFLESFQRMLTEGTPGFDGDIDPLVTNTYSGTTYFHLTDGATTNDDTRWGEGGLPSAFYGGFYADRLYGGEGNDRMFGGGGNDELHGDADDDIIYGQAQNDTLYGGGGNDVLRGGAGNDELHGGEGHDLLDGDDATPDATGHDVLRGGAGSDTLTGGAGDDKLYGDDGADLLVGGAGSDSLEGGAGNDVYAIAASSGFDTIFDSDRTGVIQLGGRVLNGGGQLRRDDADYAVWIDDSDPANVITYSLNKVAGTLFIQGYQSAVQVKSFSAGDLGINVAANGANPTNVNAGSPGADILVGSYTQSGSPSSPATETTTGDWLIGGQGNDELFGYLGDDLIEADAGNNLLAGGYGNDILIGGAGRDVVLPDHVISPHPQYQATNIPGSPPGSGAGYAFAGHTLNVLGAGNVWVVNPVGYGVGSLIPADDPGRAFVDDAIDTDAGDDVVFAGEGRDAIWLGEGADVGFGNGGADYIEGGSGADLIYGDGDLQDSDYPFLSLSYTAASEHGDDIIDGGGGADRIYGGGGSDILFGGADNDTISGDGQWFVDGSLNIPAMYQGDDFVDGGSGNDDLVGMAGADTLIGGSGDDVLHGDHSALAAAAHGADLLDGGDGNDSLYGHAGADTLIGGAGTNVLSGGDGDDLLLASGFDTVDGGAGRDVIRVAQGASVTLAASTATGADADLLFLDGNLTADLVTVTMNGATNSASSQSATLSFTGLSTVITLSSQGAGSVLGGALEEIIFADGSIWTQADLQARIRGASTGGNDELWALNGLDETLAGGDGDDRLHGASGNDTLVGGSGMDYLWGNGGDDVLEGGDGNDPLYGGSGNDTLRGGDGDDLNLYGEAGNDVLDGGAGHDWLYGGEGDDVYISSAGGDGMYDSSTTSNDVYRFEMGGGGVINDYGGDDRVELGSHVTTSNVRVSSVYGFLQVHLPDTNYVSVATFNSETGLFDAARVVETIQFSDGTQWDLARLKQEALKTTSGDDNVAGFADDEAIDGGDGNDSLAGSAGNDTLTGGNGADRLDGGYGTDLLHGGAGDDYLVGGYYGGDVLEGGTGADFLYGGNGSDVYRFNVGDGVDTIQDDGGADDRIEFGPGITQASVTRVENFNNGWLKLSLTGGDSISVYGMFGTDHGGLSTYRAIDRIVFGDGTSWSAADIKAEALRQALITTGGNDVRYLSEENDTIDGGAGNDVLHGFYGNDTLGGGAGNDTLYGGMGNDALMGGGDNDVLDGYEGDDLLQGGDGADVLRGGYGGVDTFDGGAGNDRIEDLQGADVVLFGRGDGQDVIASVQYSPLGVASTIEFKADVLPSDVTVRQVYDGQYAGAAGLELSIDGTPDRIVAQSYFNSGTYSSILQVRFADGTVWDAASILQEMAADANQELIGTPGADALVGAGGNDLLDGLAGDDTMTGRGGHDLYYVDSPGDTIVETAFGGTDTVVSSISWTLGEHLEYLNLVGESPIDGFGNAEANEIIGNAANNVLDGGAGGDYLFGSAGDDTYRVDSSSDWVEELAGEGLDTVEASVTWTLGANLENLKLIGTAAINGTGNSLDNQITGNDANNTLTGGGGNDLLDGGLGNDTMVGGAGNDTYLVGSSGDVVTESSNAGTDRVESSATFTLGNNVENLTLTGTTAINGTGNTLANILIGNGAANVLNGGSGADTMTGGDGDDTYVVDNAGDVVVEALAGGTDTAQSSVAHTLGANVEHLVLTGSSAINGTGNALDNMLTGNSGNNALTGGAGNDWLDGGAGTDTMIGGTGDDTYVVERSADVVTENAGEGTDTVRSSITYSVSALANVENVTLTGASAINATGNALSNVLIGNTAANTLTGGAGNDTMMGGAGNDTYVVDVAGDVLTELTDEGVDLVQSGISWTLGAHLENLTLTGSSGVSGTGNGLDNVLTGNSGNNTLTGGAGNDTIDGGTGNDTMVGGSGNDTYTVNVSTDVVTEVAGEGIDTVRSSVAWTLGNHLENLTLTGSGTINGTGNTLDNVLTGNSANNTLTGLAGNDTLDGGTGTDTMVGGAGDDIYIVNVSGDVTTEAANEGTDTVRSAVTRTLGNNLENLTLTGSDAINGTGNALANVLIGNTAVNVLTGAEGNDTYDGAGGNDTYSDTSTTSSDAYRWGIGSGLDALTDAGGSMDYVDVFAGVAKADLHFAQNGNHLEVTISGQADKLTINNWFASSANQVEEIRLSDGSKVLASEVPGLLGGGGMLMAAAATEAGPARKFAHPVSLPSLAVELTREFGRVGVTAGPLYRDRHLHQLVEAMAAFGARDMSNAINPGGGIRNWDHEPVRLASPL
jgi:Ca2+-binding RTX toxin-like protein